MSDADQMIHGAEISGTDPEGTGATGSPDMSEARRQIEICNACRYCEGYCAVFPSAFAQRAFSDGDITQLANLCHNCRGCFYACQYTEPHEFALNLPGALAEVRSESWADLMPLAALAGLFQRRGVLLTLLLTAVLSALFGIAAGLESAGGGFYRYLSHGLMVSLFAPAFLLPLLMTGIALRRYWGRVDGGTVRLAHLTLAFASAADMRNLAGGHGEGCNFEDEDRFTQQRRTAHQLAMYGFLLCFASTSSATVLHYLFGWPAPYPLWSLPKLFGLSGGLMLCAGTAWLAWLKTRADRALADQTLWGGEMAFVLLLFWVSLSGLLLYALGSTAVLPVILALHLGAVMALFLTLPYSKMVHGFFRLAALVRDAQRKEIAG